MGSRVWEIEVIEAAEVVDEAWRAFEFPYGHPSK
jgi:hypothetical protein